MTVDPAQARWLTGFGRVGGGAGYVFEPDSVDDLRSVLALGRRVVIRGNGRSYGDAAVLPEAVAVSLAGFSDLELQPNGVLRVGGGALLEQVWRHVWPQGFWPPVVSGTAQVTVGGAISMNIHGKNAFVAGTFGEHVRSFRLIDGIGNEHVLSPEHTDFWTISGGTGLFGVITEAEIQLKPTPGPGLDVTPRSVRNWNEQFAAFDAEADYKVSWVDMSGHGRGLFHSAVASSTPATADWRVPTRVFGVPRSAAWRCLRLIQATDSMGLLNAAKYLAGRFEKPHFQLLPAYHFLLDQLPGWERAYVGGFYQVQVFAPWETAPTLFPKIERLLLDHGTEPYLTVLKKHRRSPAVIDYCGDSWSLAMDIPRDPRFERVREKLLDLAFQHEGRFYFAKDQILGPNLPWISEEARAKLRAAKAKYDPNGLFGHQLADRVGILEP